MRDWECRTQLCNEASGSLVLFCDRCTGHEQDQLRVQAGASTAHLIDGNASVCGSGEKQHTWEWTSPDMTTISFELDLRFRIVCIFKLSTMRCGDGGGSSVLRTCETTREVYMHGTEKSEGATE